MSRRTLGAVLGDLSTKLVEARRLASDAHSWSIPSGPAGSRPLLSSKRRDAIVELAFLQAFLAWEQFLEQAFILYLVGQAAPRGRAPRRYVFPPDKKTAASWLIPEARQYAEWTDAQHVSRRAERFFKSGSPFTSVLRAHQHVFDEARLIRNAIAHRSTTAHEKFHHVARQRLGALPLNLTVGSFLGSLTPTTTPPTSFLEFYLERIEFVAGQIVPS